MNSLKTVNEYFTKPTSVGYKPGYIRTAAARHVVMLGAERCGHLSELIENFWETWFCTRSVPTCSAHPTYKCKHVMCCHLL